MKTELFLVFLAVALTSAGSLGTFEVNSQNAIHPRVHHHAVPFGPLFYHRLFRHLPFYKHVGILPYLYTELSILFFIKVKAAILVGAFIFFMKYFGNYYYHHYFKGKFKKYGHYPKTLKEKNLRLGRKIIRGIDHFGDIYVNKNNNDREANTNWSSAFHSL